MIGPAKYLLENNTVFPAIRPFLPPEDMEKLSSHFLESSVPGISGIAGFGGMNSKSSRVKKGYCKSCLIESSAADGRPIWRRGFIVPGIIYCGKHEEPISLLCAFCHDGYFRKNGQPYISEACGCHSQKNLSISDEKPSVVDKHIAVANAFQKLLDGRNGYVLTYNQIVEACFKRCSDLELTKNGRANNARINEFLNDNQLHHATGKREFREMVTGRVLPRNAVSSIRNIITIFGSWTAMEHEIFRTENARNTIRTARPLRRKLTNMDELCAAKCARVKDRYHELRSKFPDATHHFLVCRLPSGDRKYASLGVLGIKPRQPGRSVEWREQYYADLDESLEQHIWQQHVLLVSANIPARLSCNLLLKGHRMVSVWSRIKTHLPRSRAALKSCEENETKRRIRILKFIANS